MKKVLAERSQKTQSFQWPVSAVWSTFSALVEIIDATTMRAPQDWRRSVRGIPRAVEQPRSRVCALTRLMAAAAHAQLLRQCQFS